MRRKFLHSKLGGNRGQLYATTPNIAMGKHKSGALIAGALMKELLTTALPLVKLV